MSKVFCTLWLNSFIIFLWTFVENFQYLNNTMWNETAKYVEYGRRLRVAQEKDFGFLTNVESALFYYMFTPRLVSFAQMFIECGYELRFCGGTVRDIISGVPPDDLDFATSATVEQLEDMFEDYNITVTNKKANQDGIFHVVIDSQLIEVSTLKSDPNEDFPYSAWKEDAALRDLTVNAMYLGLDASLFDYFEGYEDLRRKKIRFVGNGNKRIRENYIRILRYFRYFGQIVDNPAFHDAESLQAIKNNAVGLASVSGKILWKEFQKILTGNFVEEIVKKMFELGLSTYLGLGPANELDIETFEYVCHFKKRYSFRPITYVGALLSTAEQINRFSARMSLPEADYDLLNFAVCNKDKRFFDMPQKST